MTHPSLAAVAEALAEQDRTIATLRDALAWYAQSSNWRREIRNVGPRRHWTNSKVAFDRGSRAKLALLMMEGGR